MNLGLTLHLVAGVGALVLGGGVLVRHPRRGRNRSFAVLCAALALWNLGVCAWTLTGWPAWRQILLIGSCASAPLSLDFAARLAGWPAGRRRAWLVPSGLAAATLWALSWTARFGEGVAWTRLTLVVLGGILIVATALLLVTAVSRSPGSDRRALFAVAAGGLVAVVGGLSDFVPRPDGTDTTRIGPLALLVFLLVVSVVLARHRFLDADRHVLRIVALLAGAATTAALFYLAVHFLDAQAHFLTLFATALVVLAAAGPLGRRVLTGASALLSPPDPLARVLVEISRELPRATRSDRVWGIVDERRLALTPEVRLEVYLRDAESGAYRQVHRSGPPAPAPTGDDASEVERTFSRGELATLLATDRLPLTLRYLELEGQDLSGERGARARTAAEEMRTRDLRFVVPVLDGDRLRGWIAIGGNAPERWLTADVAAAAMAVGNQAAESLERIAAVDLACRRESLAAVGELAAGLAHEVRNPLAAIRGASQAMGTGSTDEQRREMRRVIEEESERLGRFVGEFLDYARPDSPRREPLDLERLAGASIERMQLSGAAARIELTGGDRPAVASGDPDQIGRALDNLLRNACEAGGESGKVRVEVGTEGTDHVFLSVADEGPGIAPEEIGKLFQPFHTTKAGGTGLGLALVHRIVEAHGGEVRVGGQPGVGAVFTISLPAADAQSGL